MHGPALLLHETVHHGHSEARSLSLILGGEEGLEDPVPCLLVHADTGVGHRYAYVSAGLHVGAHGRVLLVQLHRADLDLERSAMGHGVPGVGSQVQEHLLHGGGIHLHGLHRLIGPDRDLDSLGQEGPEHRRQLPGNAGDVGGYRLQLGPPSEAEELPGHGGGPPHRVLDLGHLGSLHRLPRIQSPHDELSIEEDDREHVVEVVGDAAGELADGLHLLRVAELLLQLPPHGDVLHDHLERLRASLLVRDHPAVEPDGDYLAVLPLPPSLHVVDPFLPGSPHQPPARGGGLVQVPLQVQGQEILLRVVAQHPYHRGVDRGKTLLGSGPEDSVRGVLYQTTVCNLGAAERLLRLLALGDVLEDDDGADDPPLLPDWAGRVADGDRAVVHLPANCFCFPGLSLTDRFQDGVFVLRDLGSVLGGRVEHVVGLAPQELSGGRAEDLAAGRVHEGDVPVQVQAHDTLPGRPQNRLVPMAELLQGAKRLPALRDVADDRAVERLPLRRPRCQGQLDGELAPVLAQPLQLPWLLSDQPVLAPRPEPLQLRHVGVPVPLGHEVGDGPTDDLTAGVPEHRRRA